MRVTGTDIADVKIIEPDVFVDERGFFFESYNKRLFQDVTGIIREFVQDNHSLSSRGVLMGLHYQISEPQGKLVRVISGEVLDIAVDIRKSSASFGNWVGINLSAANKRQMWIPEGFAHGYLVLSDEAEFLYKTTEYYNPLHERCIRWDDRDLAIDWQFSQRPIVSDKDRLGATFRAAEVFE